MTARLILEFEQEQGIQSVLAAIDAYRQRLRASIERSQRQLAEFEDRNGVSTAHFLEAYTAEDLAGGDLEYVEWAGEARLLEGLQRELTELEAVRYELPGVS